MRPLCCFSDAAKILYRSSSRQWNIGNLEWNYSKVQINIFFQANYKHSVSPPKLFNGSIVIFSPAFKKYTYKIPILYLNAQLLKHGVPYESPGPYIFTSFSRRGPLRPNAVKMAQSYSAFPKMSSNRCVWFVNAAFCLIVGFISRMST